MALDSRGYWANVPPDPVIECARCGVEVDGLDSGPDNQPYCSDCIDPRCDECGAPIPDWDAIICDKCNGSGDHGVMDAIRGIAECFNRAIII